MAEKAMEGLKKAEKQLLFYGVRDIIDANAET